MTKLTIGMPTYNGQKFIATTIESILTQLDGHDCCADVELLISDNGSTDDTAEIIAECCGRFPNAKTSYYRNERNEGVDRNMDLVFERAKGEFVWLFACDDVQNPGAIDRVLKCLDEQPDVDIVMMDFDFYDSELKVNRDTIVLNNGQDCLCSGPDEFVRLAKLRYSMISTLVFRRQTWLDTETRDDIGLLYRHVHKLLMALPTSQAYIIAEPMFKGRGDSENFLKSGDDMIIVPLEFLKLCFALRALPYQASTVRRMVRAHRKYLFRNLRYAAKRGFIDRSNVFRELFKYNYLYPPFYFRILYLLR